MAEDLLAEFSSPVPYTSDSIEQAPRAPGVHVVLEDGEAIYVGRTGNLRGRMRQHLQGDRQASVLHQQVGELLDTEDHVATKTEIAQWLSGRSVCWRETDDPNALKEELVEALRPRFNRATARSRMRVWWVNQSQSYPQERELAIAFAGTEGARLEHRMNVGRMRVGDVTVHYRQGHVVALGEVVTAPVRAIRPYGPRELRDGGLLTRVEYFPLDGSVSLDDLPDRTAVGGPFDRFGNVRRGYAFPVPAAYAEAMRASFTDRWPEGSPWSGMSRQFWLFSGGSLERSAIGDRLSWEFTGHRDVRLGDGVVLWESGAQAGMYALAHVFGRMGLGRSRRGESRESRYSIAVTVDRLIQPRLLGVEVARHPVLRELDVLRPESTGTIFSMTAEQWRAVLAAIPLTDDESGVSQSVGMRDSREVQRDELADASAASSAGFDRPYRGKPTEGDYPEVQATSPAARERAVAEHDALCRQLIAHLANLGIEAGELTNPPADIAWRDLRGRQVIAEVKSCFDGNDTEQLRFGLGQILEYRQRLAGVGRTADAILLVTRVIDPVWYEICRSVDVRLLAGDEEASWDFGG